MYASKCIWVYGYRGLAVPSNQTHAKFSIVCICACLYLQPQMHGLGFFFCFSQGKAELKDALRRYTHRRAHTRTFTHAYTLHKHLKIFLRSPLPPQSYIICQVEFFNQCKPKKKDLGNLEQVPKRDRFPNEKHDFSVANFLGRFFGFASTSWWWFFPFQSLQLACKYKWTLKGSHFTWRVHWGL